MSYDEPMKPGQKEGAVGTLRLTREYINNNLEALSKVDRMNRPALDPETTRIIKTAFKIDDNEFNKNQKKYIDLAGHRFNHMKVLLDDPGTQLKVTKEIMLDRKGRVNRSSRGELKDEASYFNKDGNLILRVTDKDAFTPEQGASRLVTALARQVAHLDEREGFGLQVESRNAFCTPESFTACTEGLWENRERQARSRVSNIERRDDAHSIADDIIHLANSNLDPVEHEKARAQIEQRMNYSFPQPPLSPAREEEIRSGMASVGKQYNNLTPAQIQAQLDAFLGGKNTPSSLGEDNKGKPPLTRQNSAQTMSSLPPYTQAAPTERQPLLPKQDPEKTLTSNSSPPPRAQTTYMNDEELKKSLGILKDNLHNFTYDEFKEFSKVLKNTMDEAFEKKELSADAIAEAYEELSRQRKELRAARSSGSDDQFAADGEGSAKKNRGGTVKEPEEFEEDLERSLERSPSRSSLRTVADIERASMTTLEHNEPEEFGEDLERSLERSPSRSSLRTVGDIERASTTTQEHNEPEEFEEDLERSLERSPSRSSLRTVGDIEQANMTMLAHKDPDLTESTGERLRNRGRAYSL